MKKTTMPEDLVEMEGALNNFKEEARRVSAKLRKIFPE